MAGADQNITLLLKDWSGGKKEAFDDLLPLVYEELRRRASQYLRNERSGHTLQTTALINEAYIKLIDKDDIAWESRSHFFAIASTAMRRILVDHARTRKRKKRGGKEEDLPLDEALVASSEESSVDLVALDDALDRLAVFDERQAKVVELRYFSGLTIDETAEILGISNVTVRREWTVARAWLHQEIG
ncbi:MAG: sigma-70 family RNA polymerase sigma factor [Pyrinomonadaceae bacterium]